MKYMKLGTKPDTFYTEEAVRSVLSDVPADLIIRTNSTKFLLHKCGLLQRFCSNIDSNSDQPISIALHDIPGGEEAFELCAKFCYGITISLSAHNFVQAISAARFLQMTESVAKGNFIMKLESFFESFILHGWKDPIVTLQSAGKLSGWLDNPKIVQPCMDAIVEKILTHPSKVTWSYTYTRPGYSKKDRRSVPKDWWTEDVSELDLDLFRSVISTVRATRKLPAALMGEALHVYACKHLPDPMEAQGQAQSSTARTEETLAKHKRVLESIVSMIPSEAGSVSGRFLLRLLKVAIYIGASPSTKAELVRRSGRQLDEATTSDLLIPLPSNPQEYDIGAVDAVLENFLLQFRRPIPPEESERMLGSMARVGKIFDSYLQVIAQNTDLPVSKFADLAESLPDMARQEHDGLYQAIDTYLKEHPDLSKTERKRLCQLIDCQKLSPEARAHAIANDRLPLRTIVQLLFAEQERAPPVRPSTEISEARVAPDDRRRPRQGSDGMLGHTGEQVQGGRAKSLEMRRMGRSPSESRMAKKKELAVERAEGSGNKIRIHQ
ncbi:BTB/POZ domain-containing protein At5g47800 isoform X2 [Phoenix dactylifera]|uniref:BTB/POZ domain-containing protein At5g47800 isoform X2 n=1 Tax=Phoenix dactylifera TaxID=42345 RepID=A0A8B9AIP8_PHODC|nr:BTB/POZ domain-containing protein At5g47800 isoform X2 [Phoenix dactylifera]